MQVDERIRTQLGKIGVLALAGPPELTLNVPPKGWNSGARRAAEIGSVYGGATTGVLACLPSGILAGVLCPVLYLVGYIPGAGIGALIGAPLGAALAEPVETVEQAEASLKILLADPTIPELLRNTVVQLTREQTSYNIVHLADRSFVDNGISTTLELKVTAAGLCGSKELSFDPLLRVCMTVRSRLIRTSDETVLDDRTIAFDDQIAKDRTRMEPPGGRKTFTHWAANNGQLLQDELTRTAKSLAEKTVEELFLLSPVSPILATQPRVEESLQPILTWDPFPGLGENVTYDLTLWRAKAGWSRVQRGPIVYERQGLTESSHQIETPLEVSTHYLWAVRAHSTRNGETQVTLWSYENAAPVPDEVPYYQLWTPTSLTLHQ